MARSPLDCYQPESHHCAECRFAIELPMALACAADDAARDENEEEAHRLIALAYQVADSLLPPADTSPPPLLRREWTGCARTTTARPTFYG